MSVPVAFAMSVFASSSHTIFADSDGASDATSGTWTVVGLDGLDELAEGDPPHAASPSAIAAMRRTRATRTKASYQSGCRKSDRGATSPSREAAPASLNRVALDRLDGRRVADVGGLVVGRGADCRGDLVRSTENALGDRAVRVVESIRDLFRRLALEERRGRRWRG